MSEAMPLADLLRDYTPGDGHSWDDEMQWIKANHWDRYVHMYFSIQLNGFYKPILLGDDGRVWDGHHRITAAYQLGIKHVPVEHAKGDDDAA